MLFARTRGGEDGEEERGGKRGETYRITALDVSAQSNEISHDLVALALGRPIGKLRGQVERRHPSLHTITHRPRGWMGDGGWSWEK